MIYLTITLQIDPAHRADAAAVYQQYKAPFLKTVPGALSKNLLVREQDVQVLHGFATEAQAQAYLSSPLFTQDVAPKLQPLWTGEPDIRIYTVAD